MRMRLKRAAYTKMVEEDKAWLLTQPRTLERDHIVAILDHAVEYEYGVSELSVDTALTRARDSNEQ